MLHAPPPVPTQDAFGRACRVRGWGAAARPRRSRRVGRQLIDARELAVDGLGESAGIQASSELLEGGEARLIDVGGGDVDLSMVR